MNEQPLITIGITSYNALDSINAAIQSAQDQTWGNTEIVVVDDCSTDGTWEALQTRKDKGEALRLFQNPKNGGVAVSRNRIIKEAKGAFVAFFDDDDFSQPERLEKQYNRIMKNEHPITLCHTDRLQKYPDGSRRIEPTIDGHSGMAVAKRILFGRPLKNRDIGSLATCSQMAKLSTYQDLGGFDENFRRGEDTDLAIRTALEGGHFVGVREPLVEQTMTASSDKKLKDEHQSWSALLDKHALFLKDNAQHIHAQAWLDLKFQYYRGDKGGFVFGLLGLFLKHPILTGQRLLWSAPNIGFNMAYKKFQNRHRDI